MTMGEGFLQDVPAAPREREPNLPSPKLGDAAFYGLPGEVAYELDPFTEADLAGVLLSFVTGFGNAVGPGPHAVADGAAHPARINLVLVGPTSRGRKGSAWAQARRVLVGAESGWGADRIMGGLASGEGLVSAVGDDSPDRRLLVVEPEFARVLTVAGREGSTLSSIVREAWDTGDLRVMTRKDPLRATGAHVSLITHVTGEELQRRLSETEQANGFANRFLFALVQRSKLLPAGEEVPTKVLNGLIRETASALGAARGMGTIRRTPEAEERWAAIYTEMAETAPDGLVGAVTARAEAQALRLSVAYALMDGSPAIEPLHVEAAYAVWRFAEASAAKIFAGSLGDPIADRLLLALRAAGEAGLDGARQHALFGRHVPATRLEAARRGLENRGLARTETEATGGRPRIVTFAVAKQGEKANQGVPVGGSFADSLDSQEAAGDR
jgi:hypothetical protein